MLSSRSKNHLETIFPILSLQVLVTIGKRKVYEVPAESQDVPLVEGRVDAHDGQRQVDQEDLQDEPDQGRACRCRQSIGTRKDRDPLNKLS